MDEETTELQRQVKLAWNRGRDFGIGICIFIATVLWAMVTASIVIINATS